MPLLKSGLLQTKIEPELAQAFRDKAAAQNQSASHRLRALILADLDSAADHELVESIPDDSSAHKIQRRSLPLPDFLCKAVNQRAAAHNLTPARWLVGLVQSHLMKDPVLTPPGLFALREASRELAAVGRNLNQLTRVAERMVQEPSSVHAPLDLQVIKAIQPTVTALGDRVSQLVRGTHQLWGSEQRS